MPECGRLVVESVIRNSRQSQTRSWQTCHFAKIKQSEDRGMLTHEENPQASSESIPVENHVTDEGEVRLAPRNRQDTSELPSVRTSFFERAAASQEKRPRLVISKMVLHNFKSYAGTVEIGPFHKVLHSCCIVGHISTLLVSHSHPLLDQMDQENQM